MVVSTTSETVGLASGEVERVELQPLAREPHQPSSDPQEDSASEAGAAAESVSGDLSGADTPRGTSWLGDVVITGLVHCACSHSLVHPDVLSLVSDEIAAVARPGSEAADDDAL